MRKMTEIRSHITERATSRIIPLVLASRSQARAEILRRLGLTFVTDPADIDETLQDGISLTDQLAELANRKVTEVAIRYPLSLILGADTVIVDTLGVVGKPEGEAGARIILSRLSGKTHTVVTGMAIVDSHTGKSARRSDTSSVTFRVLSPQTIDRYIASGEPLGKAGAYALQGLGAVLVERVEGDYNNVLGLSVVSFVDMLAELGYGLL